MTTTPWRVRFLGGAVLLLIAGLIACRAGGAEPRGGENAARPSVLVILVDALRPDHLGSYGYPRPTSPSLDAFATGALRFTNAYSASSWTKPAVPSLFTSLYPSQHGVFEGHAHGGSGLESDVLPEEAWTMAEAFAACGYSTAAFVNNAHLDARLGFAQGFERYEQRAADAPQLIARLLEWIDGEARDRPFLAYLHLLDVHWPYEPSAEGLRLVGASAADRAPAGDERLLLEAVSAGVRRPTQVEVERLIRRYDGEIRDVDAALGQLLEVLDRRGLASHTAVVVLADHGETFLEHDRLGHGADLYEESLRIPLLLRLPAGMSRTGTTGRFASIVDVMPTLLDVAGCAATSAIEGRSLLAPPAAGVGAERAVYAELRHGSVQRQAWRHGPWKMIRTVRIRDPLPPSLRSGAGVEPADLPGMRLEVQGLRSGDAGLEVESVEVEDPADSDDEIEGPIEELDPRRRAIRVAGYWVDLDTALLRDGQPALAGLDTLLPGQRVKADGRALGPVRLRASKLRLVGPDDDTTIEGLVRSAAELPDGRIELQLAALRAAVPTGLLQQAFADFTARQEAGENTTADLVEFYDLHADPGERRRLSESELPHAAGLLAALRTFESELARHRLRTSARVGLDDATASRLRALGYLK